MNVQDVQKLPFDLKRIFTIQSESEFNELAIQTFQFQYENCAIYRQYVNLIKRNVKDITRAAEIPYLPISFFKSHAIKSFSGEAEIEFHSSGTTSENKSKHFVADATVYQFSFLKGFEQKYGHIEDYIILGLLPSYMENENSSLIYMIDHLITLSKNNNSGFFLNDYEKLLNIIRQNKREKKILLIGVTYALLELAEKFPSDLSSCYIMETGGMKGRRKELTRKDLHQVLTNRLNVPEIHSEYGMTELLSQAYSLGQGVFKCPPWMKIFIRKHNDPFDFSSTKTGGINVIDLANIYSCSFIETEDLGKMTKDGFEVMGRLDNSDLRGCNLMIE